MRCAAPKKKVRRQLIGFDRARLGANASIAGIDEAGRGALAGPVVAAAAVATPGLYAASWTRRHCRIVDDSKRLTPEQRKEVLERFQFAIDNGWLRLAVGTASVEEIARFNIFGATVLAMTRAIERACPQLQMPPLAGTATQAAIFPILIDGKPIRRFPHPHEGVVKGDSKSLLMALAGICAKESRDAMMRALDAAYPEYGFALHKGYGTPQHVEALRRHGPVSEHRSLFLRKVLGNPDACSCECTQVSLFAD